MIDYEQFEKDWKKRHKASLPRKLSVSSFSTIFWIFFWVLVATGAAVFSGAHTIPSAEMTIDTKVPFRSYLATTVFSIVEFSIFGSAVYRHSIWWMRYLLLGSLLVAFIGNTGSSWQAVAANGGNWMNQLGGLLLSIIAPVTALAAGEVLHIQLTALAIKRKEANDDYQRQWREVDAKINAAYTKLEKDTKVKLEAVNTVNLRKFTAIDRPSPKMKRAIEWIELHPEHIDTESRELANLIGVSHTLANDARKHVKYSSNGHSENGHSEL